MEKNKNTEAKKRGKKRKEKEIQTSSEYESDFVDELINTSSKKAKGIEIGTSEIQATNKPKKVLKVVKKFKFQLKCTI